MYLCSQWRRCLTWLIMYLCSQWRRCLTWVTMYLCSQWRRCLTWVTMYFQIRRLHRAHEVSCVATALTIEATSIIEYKGLASPENDHTWISTRTADPCAAQKRQDLRTRVTQDYRLPPDDEPNCARNSSRKSRLSASVPRKAVVRVVDPGFSTPRIVMHMWLQYGEGAAG